MKTLDPAVAKARSMKANAVKKGDHAAAARADVHLDRANRIARITTAIDNAPPLYADELIDFITMLVQAAVNTDA